MTKEERALFERVDGRLACIEKKLLDPDNGLFARVSENTRWRIRGQRILNWLLSGILLGVIGLLFWVIRNGVTK